MTLDELPEPARRKARAILGLHMADSDGNLGGTLIVSWPIRS